MRWRRGPDFGGRNPEKEAVRRQAGDHQSGQHGGGARHGDHLDILRQRVGDELVAGIGDQRRAGVRDQRQRRAAGQPRQQVGPHHRGVMLVIGDKRRRDAVMGQQRLGDARILCDDGVGGGEGRKRAERDVAKVADRRRDDVQALADRLNFGPKAEGGEGAGEAEARAAGRLAVAAAPARIKVRPVPFTHVHGAAHGLVASDAA